jgi:hypothetical protein
VNREERARVIELIDEGSREGLSTKDTVRRIVEEMPHLSAADVAQVARTHAEELRLEGAEKMAEANASDLIVGILEETGCRNAGEALYVLENRSRMGDTRATVLLEKLKAALITVGPEIAVPKTIRRTAHDRDRHRMLGARNANARRGRAP